MNYLTAIELTILAIMSVYAAVLGLAVIWQSTIGQWFFEKDLALTIKKNKLVAMARNPLPIDDSVKEKLYSKKRKLEWIHGRIELVHLRNNIFDAFDWKDRYVTTINVN